MFKKNKQLVCQSMSWKHGTIYNHFKHLQNTPPHILVWPGYRRRGIITENHVAGLIG